MINSLFELAVRTVKDPRSAAMQLAGLNIARRHLWLALALAVVLNTIVYQISLVLAPPNVVLPALFTSPLLFAVVIGAGLIISIFSLTYAGRFLGGTGELNVIMTLLIWLQFLRFALQLVAFVLAPFIPGLAGVLVFAASLYGIWLLLQFIDVGHGLNSLATAFGVMVLATLGIMIGLAVILSLLGIQNMGLTPYV